MTTQRQSVISKQPPASPTRNKHYRYMLTRLIDCCLRENVSGIMSGATFASSKNLPAKVGLLNSEFADCTHWLCINIPINRELWLPVKPCMTMQHWRTKMPLWVLHQNQSWRIGDGADQWLSLLSHGMSKAKKQYYDQFLTEFECAVTQRRWAASQPLGTLSDLTTGWSGMRQLEHWASHKDHPFYPTARAKIGLSSDDLEAYAPEAMNDFKLNWLAVPHRAVDGDLMGFEPSFQQVGLPSSMTHSHQLVPLHPLTASNYLPDQLAQLNQQLALKLKDSTDQAVLAPIPHLRVRPTLSVRTVSLVDAPSIHIKLPLIMRSLGHRNLRLIDPNTRIDGYVFQNILLTLEATDLALHQCYEHCDEQQGGSVNHRSDLSWILRQYPRHLTNSAITCVAALLSKDSQGKLVFQGLAEQYYENNLDQLLSDYIQLQLKTHLTLWLKHGIALESNQQNCMVIFNNNRPLKLLFRDNDSGRILRERYLKANPQEQSMLNSFKDKRIFVKDEEALMQMFVTITLQLNITSIIEGLADAKLINSREWFTRLADMIVSQLDSLDNAGVDTQYARDTLIREKYHFVKYLLLSGSLLSKEDSGAADINKYYGQSSPNPWFTTHGDA